MTHVATLVCDPLRPALDDALLAAAIQRLPGAHAEWLDRRIAADIFFSPKDTDIGAILIDLVKDQPIDIIVQPAADRRKKLLLADMDSTMIAQESVHELADFAGKRAEIAASAQRAVRGEVAVAPAVRAGVAHFAGIHVDVFDKILTERIHMTPGAETLVNTMRAHGAYTVLVSSSFTHFATPIAERIGFDESAANQLLVENGRLTGEVAEPVHDGTTKRTILLRLRQRRGLQPVETLAVGDGANDLDMLMEAGLGVGFRPKPRLAEKVAARLDHADLTALLYAQGFRRDEFSI
jgi:phosphoserine phosphatase